MVIVIIIIILVIIGAGYFLYKLAREEGKNFIEDKKAEKIEQEANRKITYCEKIENSSFDEVLNSVKDNSEELFKLKKELQQNLIIAARTKDTNSIRTYNSYLKKIDSIK